MSRRWSLFPLLAAELTSTTGSQLSAFALPWFVLTTSGSAARMSLVMAAQMAPVALFGIPSGALISWLGARRSLIVFDLLRAPLVAVVPVLYLVGHLPFAALLSIVFALGSFFTPYMAAQQVVLPEILGADERLLGQATALLQGATRITVLVGPALAGVLVAAIGPTYVLFIDAATYLVAAALLGSFLPSIQQVTDEDDRPGSLAGLHYVIRDRLLASWTLALGIGQATWQVLIVAIPVLTIRRYGGDPQTAGLFFAAFGAGAVLGSIAAYRLLPKVDAPWLAVRGKAVQGLLPWVLLLPLPAAGFGGFLLATGIANGIANPPTTAIQTARVPPHVRPHTTTTIFTVSILFGSIGLVIGGPALEQLGEGKLFLALAVLQTVSVLLFVIPARTLTERSRGERQRPEAIASNRRGRS